MNISTELKTMNRKEFKKFINNKIIEYNEIQLKEEIKSKNYKKIQSFQHEKCELKDYFKTETVDNVRINFRWRTKMIETKMNFRNMKNYSHELWQCDSCERAIETQSHLLWCPAYSSIREGKDLNNEQDLINYIKKVMQVRDELNLIR